MISRREWRRIANANRLLPTEPVTECFLGKTIRETDAVHEDHIMIQGYYLFMGRKVKDKLSWVMAATGSNVEPFFDAMQLSDQQKRSVQV